MAARNGWVVITGGLGGVMAEASRGAADAGGLTVGIVPSYDGAAANPYVNIVIPSGLGYARNVLVVASGDAIIAVGGRYGTLSEIALALNLGKPVVGLRTWSDIPGVIYAADAAAAVNAVAKVITRGSWRE